MWPTRRNAISVAVCFAGTLLLVIVQRTVDEPSGGVLTSLIFLGTVLLAGISGGLKLGLAGTFLGLLSAVLFFSPSYLQRATTSPLQLVASSAIILIAV